MRYFYFRIFRVLKKVKTNDTPAFNAMLLVIVLQAMNILSVFSIINYFYKWVFEKQQVIIGGLSLFISLFILNYILLFRKRDEIVNQYKNETKEDKTWGIIGLILYIVFSITVMFFLGETIVEKHY